MRRLARSSVDVVVTSPPYNLGISYGRYDDSMSLDAYLDWSVTWAGEVARLLKPDGSFFLNVGGSPRQPALPHLLLLRLTGHSGAPGLFKLQNIIHWIKSISLPEAQGGMTTRGHFKPINSARFLTDCHEYVFHLTLSGATPIDRLGVGVPYQDKSNLKRWAHAKGRDLRCRGNVWFLPYKTIKRRSTDRPHPATFPPELPEMCIRLHGKPQVVLDPFLGLGNSWVASIRTGVRLFMGFEIDSDYLAAARIAAAAARRKAGELKAR